MSQDTTKTEQDIKILGEPSETDPLSCKFTVDRPVYPGGSLRFTDREKAQGSPLAARIFALDTVTGVSIAGSEISVTKSDDSDWEKIGKQIGAAIRAHLRSGEPVATEEAEREAQAEAAANSDLRTRVQQVIDDMINPGVAGHGGFVSIVDVQGSRVFIHMGGGCQGCGMSSVTLKMGIEETIREELPEVTEVVDATDHSSGQNPYYQPSK